MRAWLIIDSAKWDSSFLERYSFDGMFYTRNLFVIIFTDKFHNIVARVARRRIPTTIHKWYVFLWFRRNIAIWVSQP